MGDLLDMEYINNLPQPFLMRSLGRKDWWWPMIDIDVQTGLLRIDVCGKLETKHIGDVGAFRDAAGVEHSPDDFFMDGERASSPNTDKENTK